ncbi:hypothetical protein M5689_020646 [Euphorbia peplus]|nr:hypothetical protein M5689_020646 [Euphorbia peplus]
MANSSLKFVLVTFFIFAMVLSPIIPTEAARMNTRGLLQKTGGDSVVCPLCVKCCSPAPPGSCCDCGC